MCQRVLSFSCALRRTLERTLRAIKYKYLRNYPIQSNPIQCVCVCGRVRVRVCVCGGACACVCCVRAGIGVQGRATCGVQDLAARDVLSAPLPRWFLPKRTRSGYGVHLGTAPSGGWLSHTHKSSQTIIFHSKNEALGAIWSPRRPKGRQSSQTVNSDCRNDTLGAISIAKLR